MKDREYSTIVFDLGNVLINFDHNIWVIEFNKIEPGLGTRMYNFYKENIHIQKEFESGQMSDEEFINLNLEWLDHKITSEEFCRIFSNIFSVNEEMVNLLPELKKDYNLVLLSNTSNIHKKYGWEHYSFLSNFDKFILSHEMGVIKPDEKIYRAVEQFTKEPPESHFFIDDILKNVEAAKNIGWDGVLFSGYENLRKELKAQDIL